MIAVVGGGKWGEALQSALSKNNKVVITSRNKKNLPNFVSLEEALNYEYLVITIPAQFIREWLKKYPLTSNHKILVASKGIEIKNGSFLNEIYKDFVDENNLAFISGPSFATEVKQELPTAIAINSTNKKLASKFASFFPSYIKTYICDDVIGAEIAGAYKNVIAIASGICDGLNLGNNARAALISRGLVEMARFGKYFGAKQDTFLGLSGAGDLFLTASSPLSRNYRVGYYLSCGKKIDDILKDLGEVAEGVYTTKAIYKISKEKKIYTPIANEIYKVLNGKDVNQSLKDLLEK